MRKERLVQMVAEHWGDDTARDQSRVLEFAQAVLAEQDRIRRLEDVRKGCAMNGGHAFEFKNGAGFGEITYGGGCVTVSGWKGSAACANCDAILAPRYREEL